MQGEITLKKRTTLYLEETLVEKAKKLGLNVSRVCEIALEEAIRKLEGSDLKNKDEKDAGPVGFEPTTPGLEGRCAVLPAHSAYVTHIGEVLRHGPTSR